MRLRTLVAVALVSGLVALPAVAWDDEDDDDEAPGLRQVQPLLPYPSERRPMRSLPRWQPPETTVIVPPPGGYRDDRPTTCTTLRSGSLSVLTCQ
jgi:hypothetical protein